jgi:hypothetical protein
MMLAEMAAMVFTSRPAARLGLHSFCKAYPQIPVVVSGLAIFTIYVQAMAKYIDRVNHEAQYPLRRSAIHGVESKKVRDK